MALDRLEDIVIEGCNKKRRRLNVIRYADDFVITGATEEILRDEILPVVTASAPRVNLIRGKDAPAPN